MDLIDGSLKQRRDMLELKIARRQETLIRKHKHKCAQELKSAMFRSDFATVVKASEEGNISLNYEDADTGMTPLIRAAMEDIHSSIHDLYTNSVDERVTAVAYLLDRISIHRPNVDYENKSGHTALSMACMHCRLEIIKDLLDRGADMNRKSLIGGGQTPLLFACMEGNLEVVKLLLHKSSQESGMELDVVDTYDWAVKNEQDDIVQLLAKQMK